jgi:DNA replication protein DnaC
MEKHLRKIEPSDLSISRSTPPESTPTSSDAEETKSPACLICKDAGYFCLDVPYGDPNFGHLIACECKLQQKMGRRKDELHHMSNLQPFEDKTFTNFNPDINGVRSAYFRGLEYARRPQGWLFFFGGFGSGKTHLAAAIANEAVRHDFEVLFTVVPDLLDHLRATFGPQSETSYDQRFETVRNVPLLILDDLGTENTTPWAREKLFQIVNHRYNYNLPTVFTSNQDLDRLDPRVCSRLCDTALCERIVLEAGDYRKLSIHQRFAPRRPQGRPGQGGGR